MVPRFFLLLLFPGARRGALKVLSVLGTFSVQHWKSGGAESPGPMRMTFLLVGHKL